MKKEYTKDKVIEEIKKQDVEFIRLQFTDLFGHLKNMAITSSQLKRALDNGFIFDGYSIDGFSAIEKSDMYLYPDTSTFAIFPWRPQHGKVSRMICDVYGDDGKPFSDDPRYILKKAIEKAGKAGYSLKVEPECEFFLFHADDNGQPTTLTHEQAGYLDLGPLDLGENARRDIVLTLEEMGFEVIASHHEFSPAQHEVDFAMSEALSCADDIQTFRMVVRTLAKRHGMHATFMPKPVAEKNGSGMHLKLILEKEGKNVFNPANEKETLSKEGLYFIGGVLKHIRGICPLTNPLVNSYKRLVPGFDAPTSVEFFDSSTKSPLIRTVKRDGQTCIELRSPDSAANPYLAIAAVLMAGLEGMEKKTEPSSSNIPGGYRLPASLSEAVFEMEKDPIIKKILGESCAKKYIAAKKSETDEYDRQVTAWEIEKYLYRY